MSFLVENCQIICIFFYVGGHSMLIWQEKLDTYRFIIYRLIVRAALPNLYDGVALLHCLKCSFTELVNYTGQTHCAVIWICFMVTPHICAVWCSWWQMPHPTSFQSALFHLLRTATSSLHKKWDWTFKDWMYLWFTAALHRCWPVCNSIWWCRTKP